MLHRDRTQTQVRGRVRGAGAGGGDDAVRQDRRPAAGRHQLPGVSRVLHGPAGPAGRASHLPACRGLLRLQAPELRAQGRRGRLSAARRGSAPPPGGAAPRGLQEEVRRVHPVVGPRLALQSVRPVPFNDSAGGYPRVSVTVD
uniref:Uncharacterized protein n=1 Tax=Triticum urartu TaxID=4572 RepID=A0A8R7QZZ5_TRIUA